MNANLSGGQSSPFGFPSSPRESGVHPSNDDIASFANLAAAGESYAYCLNPSPPVSPRSTTPGPQMNFNLSDANRMIEEEEPEISAPIALEMVPSVLPPQAAIPLNIAPLDLNGYLVEE